MHLITRVTIRAPLSSVTTKVLMPSRHSKDDKINCVILDEQPSLAYTEKNSELKILKEEFAVEDYAICIDKSNTDLKKQNK